MPHTPMRPPVRAALALAGALFLVAACSSDPPVSRGEVLGDRSLAVLPKAAIDAATAASGAQALIGTARCAVDVRQFVHTTVQPDGTQGSASAALLVPVADGSTCTGPFPILAYNRGTEVLRARTMANPSDPETGLLMGFFASQGYVVVATDYLGYAESRLSYHPYLHADS